MSSTRPLVAFAFVFTLLLGFQAAGQAPDPAADQPATTAISSLPTIDPAIHAAMQSRDFGEAVKKIETAIGKDGCTAPDYLRYLQGVALTESKQYDAATAAFTQLESDYPNSDWISRARFGRAHVHVLLRQYSDAGKIYQQEAERLLSRGRKDELAQIYLEFADRYFVGVPADDPSKTVQPDYTQSLAFYIEAVKLGPTTELRQQIEFRIARCQEELQQHDSAMLSYQNFLTQYAEPAPKSTVAASPTMQAEARYRLGAVQLTAGQPQQARKTWQDFLALTGPANADEQDADEQDADEQDADEQDADETKAIDALRSRAEYRLAHTYGLPTPGSVGDLELAVGLAEKFLAKHPQHKLAPQAELEIAQGYSRHNRHPQAVDRLHKFIDNPLYKDSEQLPVARKMLGQELLVQGKYDEAIAAWKQFLEQHPTDSSWPEVQKRIVDTEYAQAAHALSEKRYDDARTQWQTFLNKYPLDGRAPGILLQFANMKYDEATQRQQQRVAEAAERGESPQTVSLDETSIQLFEAAIVDWRRVVTKYPQHAEASHAAFRIGVTLEDQLGKLKEALDAYKQVSGPFQSQAVSRTTRLTSPELQLVTERKFRSDEVPRIKLTTRNLKQVTVKVYRVDMTDYFRKMHLASGVETLDIALIDPDHQFQHTIDDYQKHKQLDGDIELTLQEPGVVAVTVSSDKLEATTMVVVSDLDMIVKSSRNELFLFAENMRTGKPVEGVSVLISDGNKVFAEAITAADGILQQSYDELKSVSDLRVFAIHEGHMASTVNNLDGLNFAVGLTPRGYLYTDRPVYRKGQLVNIKGIVRWVNQDRFTFQPGESFQLDIYDAGGRRLQTREVVLNGYGTINSNIILPDSAPQGDYRVHLHRASNGQADTTGELSFETHFTVSEYKLEPVEIAIDLEKTVYFRGEPVKGSVSLKYYYGTPLSNETITYRFGPDGETLSGTTDEQGKLEFEFDTQRFSESQPLQLIAEYRERSLSAAKTVFLATRGYAVTASTMRDVYINGESFETLFKVADPAGNAVETKLNIEVFQQTQGRGQTIEKLVQTHQVNTDAQFGEARQTLTLDEGGAYLIRATGVDQFGNNVSGEHSLRISGDKDSTRLRILADRHSFDVGEQAEINLHWREQPALALVTFEGATILGYRLVELQQGDNPLQLPMEGDFAPNLFLSVAVMQRNQFHAASSEFRVSQKLQVTLKPARSDVKPGEQVPVAITVTDPQGNPVQAELSLALVQANLLQQFADVQGAVNAFFSSGQRQRSVRESTSCTFSYHPDTRGVSQFLLAETERLAILEREARAFDDLGGSMAMGISRPGDPFAADLDMQFDDSDGDGAEETLNMQQAGQYSQQIQVVPTLRFRTEIRDGRQVQVPYTENVMRLHDGQSLQNSTVQSHGVLNRMTLFDQNPQSPLPNNARNDSAAFSDYLLDADADVQIQTLNESGTIVLKGSQNDVQKVMQTIQGFDQRRQNFDVLGSWDQKFERDLGNNVTINGLTATGRFLAVNGRAPRDIEQLAREEGLQILLSMAHSETAFWDPTIVTDENGTASVTITMPTRSTAWRLHAKGINSQTLAGEASAELITKKDLFGELKLPLAFTVGDKANVPVEIHNALEGPRTIKVTLKVTLGDKSTEQTQSFELTGPGIQKLSFPVEIEEAEEAVFELRTSTEQAAADVALQTVAVRPYGFPVYQTASGTSSQSTVALLSFDKNVPAQGASLEILIGGSVNRALLESVLGDGAFPLLRCGLPTANPLERSVSDTLGGIALLDMIGDARNSDTPQAQALAGRISVAVTQMISSQHEQGGWTWAGVPDTGAADPYLSARVMWALSQARRAGFAVSQEAFDKGKAYLQTAFAAADQSDLEQQTILLHGMAVCGCGDFSFANRLYRERNRLSPAGLTHLALTLVAMKHKEMAEDLLPLIKIPTENVSLTAPQRAGTLPWMRNRTELQAMYLLTLQAVQPDHPAAAALAKSLLSQRVGSRWPVEKSNGPVIASLAQWHARTRHVMEKYTLTVSVNDHAIETLTVDPANEGSRRITVADDILYSDKPQRIELKLDGRATFSYSAVLTGFVDADKIAATTDDWTVQRRYEPAQKMFAGRPVPRGFDVVDGSYTSFFNPLSQLPVGNRGEVTLFPRRRNISNRNNERYDYLVLTEPIPAGCTVLDGSVSGAFERYEIEPGQITFYIGDRRYPNDIHYTLLGYVPGHYRVPQSILRSFYEPDRFTVSPLQSLTVLRSDQQSLDEYQWTPDEHYYLGQQQLERQNYDAAQTHLTELFEHWRLDSDNYKNVAQWLFATSLAKQNHGETVRFFEILKEKFPDVELSFEDILQVAKSYRELEEFERSFLVYRATVEASFERESQVAGFLNGRGEFVRSVQALEGLLRDYPAESYVATATYALAQETYRRAPLAAEDEKLKAAELTRVHLIDAAIQMLDHFVTTWPSDPADDQASFALATALLDLEQYEAAIARCEAYAQRYPNSQLLDSFWYIVGYSHFELEHPEEALKMCRKVAEAAFPVPETGGTRAADNRWEAIYIMGQIYHSLGQAAQAISEYAKVEQRFADASEAIKFFNRKAISLDEVTTLQPDADKQVELQFRNISEAAIKVYRIDLMKFGLMQRNLDRITAINLAGIQPYHEEVVALGDGNDFRDRSKQLTLPLNEEGAYLIVCRGENLYASGLVLVSPLELLVQEDATSGRVRVSVKDTTDDSFVGDVHVKVIGSANDDFVSADTDLRGLTIADDIRGTSTVIAVHDHDRYAFYRGKTVLQNVPPADATANQAAPQPPQDAEATVKGKDALRGNLFNQNGIFQLEQNSNWDGLLNNTRTGVQSKEAY